jgi:hypothetical protein
VKKDHPKKKTIQALRVESADPSPFLNGAGQQIFDLKPEREDSPKASYLCGYHMVTMCNNARTGRSPAQPVPAEVSTFDRNRPLNRKI